MESAWTSRHPAVVAAVSTLEPGDLLPVRDVVVRKSAAAVLLADDRTRRVVILTLVSGVWTPPTLLSGGTTWSPADRPAQTQAPWALTQPAIVQTGPPGPGGARPVAGWTALSGLAAADAVSVLARSPLDGHEVTVPADGVVFAFLRAPWHGRLEITVRTRTGDVRHVAP